MRFYLLIGDKETWSISLEYNIWGFSDKTKGLWNTSNIGDFLGDMYYLLHEDRHKSVRFNLDRFNFTAGLISMRYRDNLFRRSPHADLILQYRNSILVQKANEVNEVNKNIESIKIAAG